MKYIKMTTNRIDLTKRHEDGGWAVWLPALSGFYADQLGKIKNNPNHISTERMPIGLEYGAEGMNFLKKQDSYFYYKWALYSAGHADRDLSRCKDKEPMIHRRDRENTVVVGDSGGYQIATGVIKLDWLNVKGPQGDALREQILRWLEDT